jgi:hypothetical protein
MDLEQLPADRSSCTESVTVEDEIAVSLTFNPLGQRQDLAGCIGRIWASDAGYDV